MLYECVQLTNYGLPFNHDLLLGLAYSPKKL